MSKKGQKEAKFFSVKIAQGDVFCNRTKEIEKVVACIKSNEHMVIVAPRRYGKTSLVLKSIAELEVAYAMIDLFCVTYQEEVARKIAKSVTAITRQLMQGLNKKTYAVLEFVEGIFRSAIIQLRSGGIEITVDFSRKTLPVAHIEDLLQGLEALARKVGKKAVLFMDEFQDILKTEESDSIQSAIRSVAQHSQYITYVFSGSSRTMLEKIFDDSSQPFYMMCHKLLLGRIEEHKFFDHIKMAWQLLFDGDISESAIRQILALTECHTYYVNALCSRLIPYGVSCGIADVEREWLCTLDDGQAKIIVELQTLSPNQRKILMNIALMGGVNEPNSQVFLKEVGLPLSSVQRGIQSLMDSDYLYQNSSGALMLMDPLIKLFLVRRFEG